MWNGYGVCSNLASSGEPPLLHMTTLTTPSPFTYSVKLFLKLGTALLIGPVEKWPTSSPVRLLIHKTVSGFGWRFQNSFVRRSQTRYIHGIQIRTVIRCATVSFQSFTDSSNTGIVERHVQCAMHLVKSAAPSSSSRLHSSMNFGSRN